MAGRRSQSERVEVLVDGWQVLGQRRGGLVRLAQGCHARARHRRGTARVKQMEFVRAGEHLGRGGKITGLATVCWTGP